MDLAKAIKKIFDEFQKKAQKKSINITDVNIDVIHPWKLTIAFGLGNRKQFIIRNILENDLKPLKEFKNQLSERSRELFCPYPWDNEKKLESALLQTIKNTQQKIDASYIIEQNGQPVGHFFLWKAGGNPHSQQYGVNIPELGVAITDDLHGVGLGSLAVKILKEIAHHLNSDAIELTTAMSNDAGWFIYLKSGFQYTGNIKNPLEVDVTEATIGKAKTKKYRTERQMVYILNHQKTPDILNYLTLKRKQFQKKNAFRAKQKKELFW